MWLMERPEATPNSHTGPSIPSVFCMECVRSVKASGNERTDAMCSSTNTAVSASACLLQESMDVFAIRVQGPVEHRREHQRRGPATGGKPKLLDGADQSHVGWDHIVFLARDETLLAGVSIKLDVPGADASPMYQKKLDKAELAENILSA